MKKGGQPMQKLNLYEIHSEANKKHRYRIREYSPLWFIGAVGGVITFILAFYGFILLFY